MSSEIEDVLREQVKDLSERLEEAMQTIRRYEEALNDIYKIANKVV